MSFTYNPITQYLHNKLLKNKTGDSYYKRKCGKKNMDDLNKSQFGLKKNKNKKRACTDILQITMTIKLKHI